MSASEPTDSCAGLLRSPQGAAGTVPCGKQRYHHGDLPVALIDAAQRALEADGTFSMRGIARDVGVSAAAPYRHFPDRASLESAIASFGFQELLADLAAHCTDRGIAHSMGDLAVRYVGFARRRPALFRLMFGGGDADAVAVSRRGNLVQQLFAQRMSPVLPGASAKQVSAAIWAYAHGMASLHIDGHFCADSEESIADHLLTACHALAAIARLES